MSVRLKLVNEKRFGGIELCEPYSRKEEAEDCKTEYEELAIESHFFHALN